MKNKHRALLICVTVLAVTVFVGLSIMITDKDDNEQNNALYAEDHPTIDDVMKSTGDYVRNNKSLFEEATNSLKTVRHPDNLVAAQIGDVSLTISELEFRKGLSAAGNPAKGTLHTVFNELIEEKIILNEAVQKGLAPTTEEIEVFLARELEESKTNPEYRENIDKLIKSWSISEDEYWQKYEWYNAFRMITIDKVYKDVISEAEKTGKIPRIVSDDSASEVLKKQEAHESYWGQYTMKLKKEADIKVIDEFANELNVERDKWYLSE
ncbi:MAG: hypothetical protein PHN17_09560 [Syntrophaceticus sp.]|nr:hypothetical protein [Syntrophaceticus sp.]